MDNLSFLKSEINRTNKNLLKVNVGYIFVYVLIAAGHILYFPFSLVTDLLLLLAIWNLIKCALRFYDNNKHPIMKKIAEFGNVDLLSDSIEKEMSAGGQKFNASTLTKSWYLRPRFYGLDIIKLDSIVWAYEKVRKTKSNGAISQTDYSVILKNKTGQAYEASLTGYVTADFLNCLSSSVPGIIIGFTPELDTMYDKDLAGFLKKTEENRRTNTAS